MLYLFLSHIDYTIYAYHKSSAIIFYCINKTRFVSFFVYKRQSRDRFIIRLKTVDKVLITL